MKKLLGTLVALFLLVLPASATWSIVAVNTRTGEVAVASATCLANFNLKNWVPVLVVGKGAGAAQSSLDNGARNRIRMWDAIQAGWTADQVLDDLIVNGSLKNYRQYGIATLPGSAATWSGAHCGQGIGNVTGQHGDFFYAMQGNVLVGPEPVLAAEEAFVQTDGDMTQRMMAAMEAARLWGGDGRCSCDANDPTGCGAPPPDFDKTAHCGFVFVARMGDADGDCIDGPGCATGDYYLRIHTTGDWSDPDPVFVLQDMYDVWRAGLVGRPDHILSTVSAPAQSLPADGLTGTEVTVQLADVDGTPLGIGGSTVEVAIEGDGEVVLGDVVDHGDGTYSFPVTAGLTPGTARLVITADDGAVKATLYPYLELRVDSVTPLHVGRDVVSTRDGARVPLTLNVPEAADGFHLLLASMSGTDPGMPIGDQLLPLNPDFILVKSFRHANNDRFVQTFGHLDGAGRAEAAFDAPAGLLNNLVGLRMDWAGLTWDRGWGVTNAAGFDIRF